MNDEIIKQFENIFCGSETQRGASYNIIIKTEQCKFDFKKHLTGELQQGLSPVNIDKEACKWAAIDLDLNDQSDTKAKEVCEYAFKYDPELFVFKSRGKGFHVYKFYDSWNNAYQVKIKADEIAKHFFKKYGKKVDTTHTLPKSWNKEERTSGNWLFTPYYNITTQQCLNHLGEQLTIEQFLLKYKLRHHIFLSMIVGKKEPGRHTSLAWASQYIKHYLKDDKLIFDALVTSMFGINIPKDIEHQWNYPRNSYPKDWIDKKYKNLITKDEWGAIDNIEIENFPKIEATETQENEEIFFQPRIYGSLLTRPKKREFVIQDYLKNKNMTLLVGAPGAAKTTFLTSVAHSYVSGISLFGKKVFKTGNAILLTAEEEYNEIELRLQAIELAMGKNNTNNQIHLIGYDHDFKMVKFSKDSTSKKMPMYSKLEEYVKKNNITFIGIDPLISYQAGNFDENNNAQMDDFCKNYLIKIATNNNASIMVAHHVNKISMMQDEESNDNAMYSGRGASSLVGAARIVIGLSQMSKKLWEKEYKKEVTEYERKLYVAIIDAKNNYSSVSETPKWIKKSVYKIECEDGFEDVAALIDCNLTDLKDARSDLSQQFKRKACEDIISKIQNFFKNEEKQEVVNLFTIAKTLANQDPRITSSGEKTLIQEYQRTIQGGLLKPMKFGCWTYQYKYDHMAIKTKHKIERTHDDLINHDVF